MNLRTVTAPPVEPITLAEAKAHLGIGDEATAAQNAYITGLIQVAREYAEHYTGRALVQRTLELTLPSFSYEIELPRPPLVSVSYVKYLETAGGVLTTVDPAQYQVDTYQEPGVLRPAHNSSGWPAVRGDYNAVQIGYVAGYPLVGSPADYVSNIPAAARQWMKIRVGQWFEFREPIIVGTIIASIPRDHVDGLLDPIKVWNF